MDTGLSVNSNIVISIDNNSIIKLGAMLVIVIIIFFMAKAILKA